MSAPATVLEVREEGGGVPFVTHPGWAEGFPWLVQGTTTTGEDEPFDLALFGDAPGRAAHPRWDLLREATGFPRAVHGRQVHRTRVLLHHEGPPGLHLAPDTDGHATRAPGVLLTVATADCVPIFLVDPPRRAVALLHGGWRGVAAGILERGVEVLGERLGTDARELHMHLGPAICGSCYEVGPEVHAALSLEEPERPTPVDLRAVLAERAGALGVPRERVSVSGHCTRCTGSPLFSHRGGDAGRQVSFIGVRARGGRASAGDA